MSNLVNFWCRNNFAESMKDKNSPGRKDGENANEEVWNGGISKESELKIKYGMFLLSKDERFFGKSWMHLY